MIIALLMRCLTPAAAAAVHNFIFGYGSLICSKSRSVTIPEHANKIVTPVVVEGLERVWSKRSKFGMTAVGVAFAEEGESNAAACNAAACVGVLLPVSRLDLRQFDEREQGYNRVLLDLDQVNPVPFLDPVEHYSETDHEVFLEAKEELNNAIAVGIYSLGSSSNSLLVTNDKISDIEKDSKNKIDEGDAFTPSVNIWVYVPQKPMIPTVEYPISQIYVDTILRGCLDISEEFAAEFLETTTGWHPDDSVHRHSSVSPEDIIPDQIPLVNDRQNPIYIRGDREWSLRKSAFLDRFMHKYRPDVLSQRQMCKKMIKPKTATTGVNTKAPKQ